MALGCKKTALGVVCDTGTVFQQEVEDFGLPGQHETEGKKHTLLTRGADYNIGKSRLFTRAHSNSNAAGGVDHDELIAIDGDENAKYGNSSGR